MDRVLMVVQNYFPKDIRVKRYVNILYQHDIIADVICIGEPGDKSREDFHKGEIIRKILPKLRSNRFRYLYEYLSFFLFSFFTINKLIKKRNFSAIHFHTLPDLLVFSGIIAKRKGVKLILDLHEILPEFYAVKYDIKTTDLIFKFLKYIERICVNYADFVITVNDSIQKLVSDRTNPRREISVIMNTVDPGIIKKRKKRAHLDFNIFYCGTIMKISGLELVINALADIRNENIKFHILGEGPREEYLKNMADRLGLNNNIIFHGYINNEDVPEYLQDCDAGIIPQENNIFIDHSFANKLAEFIYHEIPVIATDLKATRDYFTGDSILFTVSGNVNSIKEAILKLYSSESARESLVKNASEHYKKISWEHMEERYMNIIYEIMKNRQ